MLDILIPTHLPNLELVQTCLEAIDNHPNQVPTKIWLALDGVTKADCGELEEFLAGRLAPPEVNQVGRPGAYQLQHEPPPRVRDWDLIEWPGSIYVQRAIENSISRMRQEFVLILPPWIEFTDDRWFGKLQQPYVYDQQCMLVAVPSPGDPQTTLPPAKFDRRRHPSTEAILTRRNVLQDIVPNMSAVRTVAEWVSEFSRVAEIRGGTRWLAPAVRYRSIEHQPWQLPENSETETPSSESRSPTTESSSSPTTTEADGPGVSVPF